MEALQHHMLGIGGDNNVPRIKAPHEYRDFI